MTDQQVRESDQQVRESDQQVRESDQHVPAVITGPETYARVSRESILTGVIRTMELKKYSQEEFDRLWYAYNEGKIASLEEAFPLLSPNAREFLRTGTFMNEWDSNQ